MPKLIWTLELESSLVYLHGSVPSEDELDLDQNHLLSGAL